MSDEDNTIDQINAAMSDAIEAQEAGDFRAAAKRARTAWMLIGSIPDSELNEERLKWNREGLERIVKELSRLAQSQPSGSSGHGCLIRPIEIGYERG
jgi:hypothetical protein